MRTLSRRRAQPRAAGAPVRAAGQRAGARRADQRPRHRHPRAARGAAAELRRHGVPGQPRPRASSTTSSPARSPGKATSRPGLWREYEGGYEDWKLQRDRAARAARGRRTATQPRRRRRRHAARRRAAAPAPAAAAAAKPRKLSYKEQRELDALPARIEALEAEQKELGALLASAELYAEDPARAEAAQMRYAQIDDELLPRSSAGKRSPRPEGEAPAESRRCPPLRLARRRGAAVGIVGTTGIDTRFLALATRARTARMNPSVIREILKLTAAARHHLAGRRPAVAGHLPGRGDARGDRRACCATRRARRCSTPRAKASAPLREWVAAQHGRAGLQRRRVAGAHHDRLAAGPRPRRQGADRRRQPRRGRVADLPRRAAGVRALRAASSSPSPATTTGRCPTRSRERAAARASCTCCRTSRTRAAARSAPTRRAALAAARARRRPADRRGQPVRRPLVRRARRRRRSPSRWARGHGLSRQRSRRCWRRACGSAT